MLVGFQKSQSTWIFFFFRSFPYLTFNLTMIPAVNLVHIILKYIYEYCQIIILNDCGTEGFFYLHKYRILLYLKVTIQHLTDSSCLVVGLISSSAVTIIFFLCRMFSEETLSISSIAFCYTFHGVSKFCELTH